MQAKAGLCCLIRASALHRNEDEVSFTLALMFLRVLGWFGFMTAQQGADIRLELICVRCAAGFGGFRCASGCGHVGFELVLAVGTVWGGALLFRTAGSAFGKRLASQLQAVLRIRQFRSFRRR